MLDSYRLYGMTGERYPQKQMYAIKTEIKEASLEPLLLKCMDRVMEWNTYMCGFHKDKEDSFLQLPMTLDDDIVDQIKEDRMMKLVTKEIKDFEANLAEIDEEEYDVLCDVSEGVFEELLGDLLQFLNK